MEYYSLQLMHKVNQLDDLLIILSGGKVVNQQDYDQMKNVVIKHLEGWLVALKEGYPENVKWSDSYIEKYIKKNLENNG